MKIATGQNSRRGRMVTSSYLHLILADSNSYCCYYKSQLFLNYCPGEAHKLNSYSREENLSNPNDTRTPENTSTKEKACLYFSQD